MRFAGLAALVLIVSVSFVSAGVVPTGEMIPITRDFSRGLYQCDDGEHEYFWYADYAGEGMANQFNAGGIARIDTLFFTVVHVTGEHAHPYQSAYICVWDDAGGVPGDPLYMALLELPVPDQGYYWWVALDLVAENIVVDGDFWIGYLDDATMMYEPLLDNPTSCNTWMYTPAGGWQDMDDYAGDLGLYFRAWASEGVPVELVSFEANAQDGAVVLEWSTATEQNNFGYYMLRSLIETDGYAMISDIIRGAGTSAEPHSYSHTDSDVAPGIRYFYKLVDVDTAGNESQHGPVNARLAPADASSWGQIKAEFE